MVKILTPTEILIEELFRAFREGERCPHIRKDDEGPYCAIRLNEGDEVEPKRRLVCDAYSLQLWCLDKRRCDKCIFYLGRRL